MIEFIAVSSGQAKKAVLLSFYFRNKPSPLLLGGASHAMITAITLPTAS
jgi:hypothetical protein